MHMHSLSSQSREIIVIRLSISDTCSQDQEMKEYFWMCMHIVYTYKQLDITWLSYLVEKTGLVHRYQWIPLSSADFTAGKRPLQMTIWSQAKCHTMLLEGILPKIIKCERGCTQTVSAHPRPHTGVLQAVRRQPTWPSQYRWMIRPKGYFQRIVMMLCMKHSPEDNGVIKF